MERAEVREGNARAKTQRQFINDHGRPVIISVVNTGRACENDGERVRGSDFLRLESGDLSPLTRGVFTRALDH